MSVRSRSYAHAVETPPPEKRRVIGWREWVGLPELGIETIKAKVDTGARTSSLHALDVEELERDGVRMVRFRIHPDQHDDARVVEAEAPLCDHRRVTPSSGRPEMRPVVLATLTLCGLRFQAELTLTRRDAMGFRMLLGREATRGRFVVDPARSYLGGRRVKGTHRLKKQRGKRP